MNEFGVFQLEVASGREREREGLLNEGKGLVTYNTVMVPAFCITLESKEDRETNREIRTKEARECAKVIIEEGRREISIFRVHFAEFPRTQRNRHGVEVFGDVKSP
jgi:hypothetical protein